MHTVKTKKNVKHKKTYKKIGFPAVISGSSTAANIQVIYFTATHTQ